MHAGAQGLMVFGISMPLFALLAFKLNLQSSALLLVAFILVCSAAASAVVLGIAFTVANGAGRTFGRFTMGGSTTPYVEQYSREQAMVMRGDVDGALQSFEAVIRENPDAIDARIKAAELYAKEKGDHRRAAELFREVQRIPTVSSGQDIYAMNRLADLFNGPLGEPGRALVELRRLVERYPNSPAATHARTALKALKPRLPQD